MGGGVVRFSTTRRKLARRICRASHHSAGFFRARRTLCSVSLAVQAGESREMVHPGSFQCGGGNPFPRGGAPPLAATGPPPRPRHPPDRPAGRRAPPPPPRPPPPPPRPYPPPPPPPPF